MTRSEDLAGQELDPDDPNAPTSFYIEPEKKQALCPHCNELIQDIGLESADAYTWEKRWLKCGCGLRSIKLSPPKKVREREHLGDWNRRIKGIRG